MEDLVKSLEFIKLGSEMDKDTGSTFKKHRNVELRSNIIKSKFLLILGHIRIYLPSLINY